MLRYFFIIVNLVWAFSLSAQISFDRQIIGSSGSNKTNTTPIGITWTVGEALIGTSSGGTLTLTQGFQQSDQIVEVDVHHHTFEMNLRAYPNPANSIVFLEISSTEARTYLYELYNINGQKIALPAETEQPQKFIKKEISFHALEQGTYILVVYSKSGEQLVNINIVKI